MKVASYGKTSHEAYLKAVRSTGFKLPQKAVLFGIEGDYQGEALEAASILKQRGLKVTTKLYC